MAFKIDVKGRKETMQELRDSIASQVELELLSNKKELKEALKAATPIDTGKARAGWTETNKGLENNVEYISDLNMGTSSQAPVYFIEKTLLAHEGVNPSGVIVRKKILPR